MTHHEVPGYGMVYICVPDGDRPGCLGQMARMIGWHHPDALTALEEQLELTESAAEGMKEELLELRQLDHIVRIVKSRRERAISAD